MKNSIESIFELQFTFSAQIDNKAVADFYGSDSKRLGYFTTSSFIAKENDVYTNTPFITDKRRSDNIAEDTGNGYYGVFKYSGFAHIEGENGSKDSYLYRGGFDYPNWIFYRVTDIMLMKAEALTQLYRSEEDKQLAIHMVNTVFLRSNPTILDTLSLADYPTKKELEELVLLERQRELIFEGKRWFDLMRVAKRDGNTDRLVKAVVRKDDKNSSIISSKLKDMNALYMPVQERELDLNDKLVQNPFYLTDVL